MNTDKGGGGFSFSRLADNASNIGKRLTTGISGLFHQKNEPTNKNPEEYYEEEDDSDDCETTILNNLSDPTYTTTRSYGSIPHESFPNDLRVVTTHQEDARQGRDSALSSHDGDFDDETTLLLLDNEDEAKPRHKLSVPIINVSQDFNFLTVDTTNSYPGGNYGGNASYFPPAPVSPTPTFASSFEFQHQPSRKFSWKRSIKIAILVFVFLFAATLITMTSEQNITFAQITTKEDKPFQYPIHKLPDSFIRSYPVLSVTLKGAFLPVAYENVTNDQLIVSIEKEDEHGNVIRTVSKKWRLSIIVSSSGSVPESTRSLSFNLLELNLNDGPYSLVVRTNSPEVVPISISIRTISEGIKNGAVYGGAVLIGLYILIIFELVNRTLSAMLAAGTAIAILSFLNERPTTEEMVSWLDMETLILLFSMMVMVAIFCETGFFDYSAYLMYKITNGQVWPLITGLCLFTAFVSAFLDNVTTILLMTPVTIRICEAMTLNPVPVLISIVIFSNIGGAITPVGDPPNVIIASNPEVIKAGIDFASFSLHMMLGIIPVIIISYIQLRITFRNMKSLQFSEPYEVAELRREIEVWLRAADSLSSYSKDESHVRTLLFSKIRHLKGKLKTRIRMGGQTEEVYKANLLELELSCKIRDWPLLIKCGVVLTIVIIMFFLHSVPQLNLSLGWTALLGAIFLLILADRRELEGIFTRVEWSTLIFFSALFIVMEAVSKLGLLSWIGHQTEVIITDVNKESRLTVAILLILWVSGIASAFIDNIPFTTMMIQIVTEVAERIDLPLQPLIWALAFGTCLGGNGTLIGASANVVCAGVADQHGYKFTFMQYFRIGFPMMIVSLIVSTAYLMICHSLFEWNS